MTQQYELVSFDMFIGWTKANPGLPNSDIPIDWEVLCRAGYNIDLLIKALPDYDASLFDNEDRGGSWYGHWYSLGIIQKVDPEFKLSSSYFMTNRVRRPFLAEQQELKPNQGDLLMSFFFPKEEVFFPEETLYAEVNKAVVGRNEKGGKSVVDKKSKLRLYPKPRIPNLAISSLSPLAHELVLWDDVNEEWIVLPKGEVKLFKYDTDPDSGTAEFRIYWPSGYKEKIYSKG